MLCSPGCRPTIWPDSSNRAGRSRRRRCSPRSRRALRLTDDERDHLYFLGGQTPPAFHRPNAHVSPGLLHVLDHLTDSPAIVVSDLGETLVQNRLSIALSGDESHREGLDRYLIWRWFTDPAIRAKAPEEDWPIHSRTHVADLRATAARRHGDPDVVALVEQLTVANAEFTVLWNEHEVAVRRADVKRIIHPEVGLLDLQCEVLAGGGRSVPGRAVPPPRHRRPGEARPSAGHRHAGHVIGTLGPLTRAP